MAERFGVEARLRKRLMFGIAAAVALSIGFDQGKAVPLQMLPVSGQASTPAQSAPEFEVASVRLNKSNDEASMNVAPLMSDSPVSTGGLYLARNIKLIQYIAFAYRLTNSQLQSVVKQAPWVAEDRFDIEARAEGNPSMSQYRQMMQVLLADRFKLKVHYESRLVPVYALRLAKPGKLGPQMRLHRADDPMCSAHAPALGAGTDGSGDVDAEGFPKVCGSMLSLQPSEPGRMKGGGRDVSMARFAAIETGVGVVDRPMVDETGLQGNVDYVLQWRKVQANAGLGVRLETDESAPTFQEALEDQLGIKMVAKKAPIELFFVDHIEHPAPN